ncbi:MAG: hypothetical protein ACTHKB_15730 [Burkholderiaceae bacterium]
MRALLARLWARLPARAQCLFLGHDWQVSALSAGWDDGDEFRCDRCGRVDYD